MRCFGDKNKVHHCKVVLLDEQELLQEIQDVTTGQDLLDVVFKHLNLMETAYFGLRYLDPNNQTHWLDPVKKVSKQLKGTSPFTLYFSVKFYAADPCKLVEEITRYQFFLQVKQDILQGRLPVAEDLAAELGAYAVQSELGDYDPRRHSPGYISEFRFLTTQSTQLEYKIADLHKKLIGQVPSKAETCYLEKVKWLDMYGVDLHPVLVSGEDSIEYFLGLTPAGVIVLRNKAKVGNYFWPRIAKVYFRGRFFMLRVRDKNNAENTYGFETPSKGACKHLWQCCVEHHAFFRLTQATGTTPQAIFSLGSQFRYSGRTEKEVLLENSQKGRDQPEFSRVPSRRFQRRLIEGSTDIPRIDDGEVKPETRNIVSLGPTPVSTSSHMYRSKSLTLPPGSDSPRSTRSAPYPRGLGAGDSSGDRATLLSPNRRRGESPHSTRSTPANTKDNRLSRRTSSVESQSSADSRGPRRHSHRRSRGRSSDGEGSECSSKGSKGSSRGHRRHRHRNHSDDSDQHGHRRHRRRKKDRSGSGSRSMVDSSEQWMAVQAKQAAINGNAATVKDISHKSGYTPSGHETEADSHHHHSNKRRHRKHRSRSRSPSEEKKSRIPESIRKHLDFGLQAPGAMTEAELREIPYTKVETAKTVKIKYSDSKGRSKHKSPRRSKSNNSDRNKDNPPADGESPPPPYTPAPSKNGSKSNHKARVEEDRGQQSPPEDGRMVNGYHHPPPSTRSALVKTPDQELQDSIYRATPTRLTNDNHSYRYTNGSHKPVMVNGPSVKALVTNSVGSSPSFNHDSPSPPPFRDDGSNSSFASGSGFTTPNMMKNGANDRNSHFTTVLKPHPSPQSSVTSGISLGSSSVSISAESNESTNTMTSGSNTQHTTHTRLSSTSNSPDPDCQLNNDRLTTNDSPEPYYSNLSQYQNNLLYNQDLYNNLPSPKKDTTDKQSLYPSLEPMTQHSTNILIQYHDTENTDSQPSSLSTPTPRPRPRSSIISSLRSSDTSTHIVQSYGPNMSHTPTNFQTDTNSLQRSSYTSTLPSPSTITSPNDVGIPLSSSVPSSNYGFESSTLPRPSNSSKTPMRTTSSQTNIHRTTGCQTNPTNKGQTTPNTQQSPMGPEASTSSPSPNSTNLAHSALHWKVYNWDAYREQTEWSNSLGKNVPVQTPPVNQHIGGVGGRQRRGSAGSLELILGPLIQSALEHQQR